jgi:hypothetical protein
MIHVVDWEVEEAVVYLEVSILSFPLSRERQVGDNGVGRGLYLLGYRLLSFSPNPYPQTSIP